MTISVRLSDEPEAELRSHIRSCGTPMSEFVREAIEEKLEREASGAATPYALGRDLFGRHASGDRNRASDRKRLIRERIGEKHSR